MQTPEPEIVRRRVKIDFASAALDSWSGRGKDFESYLNALSFVFPPGEAFFIASVKNYLGRITDPVLKDQAERFIFQEVMHSREHARCNRELKHIHSHGEEMGRIAATVLSIARRFSLKSAQLATSCALEHFTAMLADGLLRNQRQIQAQFDPAFAELWLWHAVEETEHKGVCFDVYRQVCGKGIVSYLHRVVVMAITSLVFVGALSVGFAVINRKQRKQSPTPDSSHFRPDRKPAGAARIRFLLRAIPLKMYFDYYRFSFHPWNLDNRNLIEEWKQAHGGQANRADTPIAA